MSVFRVKKNKDYTTMSNYHLRDKRLSLKAKGLLSWMLSNTDDWDYSLAGIVACCKEGETTVNTALRELQKYGYVEIIKCKPSKDNNRIHYDYNVYEKPQDIESQGVESLVLENQVLENQALENQAQINTNNKEVLKQEILINKDMDMEWFLTKYDEICVSFPKVKSLTEKRKKAIRKILKSYSDDDIIDVFENAEASDFLKGKNDRGWKANIDFILREDKFVNILEGQYTSKKKKRFDLEGNTDPYTDKDREADEIWRKEMKKHGETTTF